MNNRYIITCLDYSLDRRLECEGPDRNSNTYAELLKELQLGDIQEGVIRCQNSNIDNKQFMF